MMSTTNNPDDYRSELERLVDRFKVAWQRGEPPAIDDYLPVDVGQRRAVRVELVHVDLQRRLERGEAALVEQYLAEYPDLAQDPIVVIDLIVSEYQLRQHREPGSNLCEFVERFPQFKDELSKRLGANEVETGVRCADEAVADETRSFFGPPSEDTGPPRQPAGPVVTELPCRFGDYDLLERLGHGGMGVVYRARQRSANRIVALKVIRPEAVSPEHQAEALVRFEREAQLTARLDHEHLVTVYDVGQVNGCPFYSMKYVEGRSLYEILRDGPLANQRAARYVESAARGVEEAHRQGILHRDLKPHNVLIDLASDRALVADFGLAKLAEVDGGLTVAGEVFGTPSYMPPEQSVDSSNVNALSDVYGLGATLYHALTGRPPFQAATHLETRAQVIEQEVVPPRQFNPGVARDLETICLKAISKEPARRYASAAQLADDLGRWLRGEPIMARPVGRIERGWRWCQRNPAVAGLTAAVALSLVSGTGVSSYFAIRATFERNRADSQAREAITQRNRAETNLVEATRERERAETNLTEANHQRERAEAGFREARAAVDKYDTSVSESKLLNVPGLQPLRKELLESALEYYKKFIGEYGDDPKVQAEMAAAYGRVGTITSAIGSNEQGLAALEKAREIYEELARESPGVSDYQDGLANAYASLGVVQSDTGRWADAEASYQRALEIEQKLVGENPTVSLYQSRLGHAYVCLGEVRHVAGRNADAEASFKRAIEIGEKLVGENPTDSGYQDHLAGAYMDLGRLQSGLPASAGRHGADGIAYINLAAVHSDTGRWADAEASFTRAIEIGEKLVRENPTVSDYQRRLAHAYLYLGDMKNHARREAEAETLLVKAIEVYEMLCRENPSVSIYREGLAASHRCLGGLLAVSGKWRESADLFAMAVKESNHNSVPMFGLAMVQLAAGDEADYRDTCTELLGRHGANAKQLEAYNIALTCVVGEHAVEDMDSVLELAKRAVASVPLNPVFQTLVGAAQFRAGRTVEAVSTLKKAMPLHSLAIAAAPNMADAIRVSQLLGEVFLAHCYRDLKNREAMQTQFEKVRALVEKLETSPRHDSPGLEPWAVPFGIEMAKRELARPTGDEAAGK